MSATRKSTPPDPLAEPPSGERDTARRRRTRARLMDAAYRLFGEHGVNGTSIEAVADEAGFSRGAFYSNFDTKEDLFLAVYEGEMTRRMTEVRDMLDDAIDPAMAADDASLLAGVAKIAEMCAEPIVADRNWFLLLTEFRAHALRDPELRERARVELDRINGLLGELMRESLDRLGLDLVVSARDAVAAVTAVYEAELERVAFADGAPDGGGLLTEVVPRLVSSMVARRE